MKYHIPLIIDDRIDVDLAMGAEGVHLGQCDMPVAAARKILGDALIIGASTKTVPQALEACEQGADYLGVGAILSYYYKGQDRSDLHRNAGRDMQSCAYPRKRHRRIKSKQCKYP